MSPHAPTTSKAAPAKRGAARATRRLAPAKVPSAKVPPAKVTHASRVVDTESGVTKGEIADYFERVAPLLMPHLGARPVAMVRAPAGVKGFKFFQKHADQNELPGVVLLDPSLDPGHEALLKIGNARGLASAAQMNVLELHTWNMTTRSMPRPDRLVFDLDPGEGVEWSKVREATELMRGYLGELGLKGFLKTSGGKGVHVVVPIRAQYEWPLAKQVAQAAVVHMASVIPQRFVAKSGAKNRVGRIFVDYLRNGWGATTAAAWSPRARPGLGVSVPIAWDELATVTSGSHWTVRNIDDRLTVGNAPWEGYDDAKSTLAKAMKALKVEAPSKRSGSGSE